MTQVSTRTHAPGARVRLRLVGAVAALVSAAVPPFLVAVLTVQIDHDIGFSTVQLGAGVATYFFVSAVFSPWSGRLVDRRGAHRPMQLSTAGCTVGLCVIAVAPNGATVVAALAVLGLSNAATQPAATHVITGIPLARARATAFGLVQSAIPATALLAGVVLAAFQSSSWRLAVLAVAGVTVLAQLPVRWVRGSGRPLSAAAPDDTAVTNGDGVTAERALRFVALMTVGGFFISCAATCLPSFLAVTGLRSGLSPSAVAAVQVAGSLASILVRVIVASHGSRMSGAGNVGGVVLLATSGALGFALLAADSAPTYVVGALLAYGCGWGWSGLFNLSVTRARPLDAATTTGMTQSGIFLGGSLGPLIFATVAYAAGAQLAWAVAACSAVLAACCLAAARRQWTL